MNELFDKCVYTIVEKSRLWAANHDSSSSDPIQEGRRWVGGLKLLREAKASGRGVALLFGDAADCSELIAWGVIDGIEIVAEQRDCPSP